MTIEMKKEILDAITNGDFYEWLCNNAYKLSHYDLTTILKEYVYVYDENALYRFSGNVVENLIECLDAE